jgi:hypothetical protein
MKEKEIKIVKETVEKVYEYTEDEYYAMCSIVDDLSLSFSHRSHDLIALKQILTGTFKAQIPKKT